MPTLEQEATAGGDSGKHKWWESGGTKGHSVQVGPLHKVVGYSHDHRFASISASAETGKMVARITLDDTLVSEGPFLKCLEFLYTGIVEFEPKSPLIDETVKVAEFFNLPELQTICENAKKGEEFVHFNPSIGTWLNDRNSGIAKTLFLNQPQLSDVRLMVEGKTILAHKVVFMARCDVLSAMFRNGFVESEISEVRRLKLKMY